MLRLLARNADTATPSLIGFPFAVVALLPLPLLGSAATLSGMGLAAMSTFVLFMPLMAIIAGGITEETDVPMTPRRYVALLALWTVADALGTQFAG